MTEIAWAAGLFEGEGCFSVSNGYLKASMNTTDLDVLQRFVKIVGVGNITDYRPGKTISNPIGRKKSWQWAVSGKKAWKIAETFEPYLGERRLETLKEISSL